MRRISEGRKFRRDLKRQKRRGKDESKLIAVVGALVYDGHLPSLLRPHRLTGDRSGLWECHIEPDWLLIYDVNDDEVLLVRTGTHSDLFE